MTHSTTAPAAATPQSSVELGWDDMDTQIEFGDVREQLADPALILASALLRVHQADEAQAQVEEALREVEGSADDEWPRRLDRLTRRQRHLVDTATVLERIAGAAATLLRHEAEQTTVKPVDDGPVAVEAEANAWPEPIGGVRFHTVLYGRHMGKVGGAEWLHVSGVGFVEITHADRLPTGDGFCYRLEGRVVSATDAHALLVTDGGWAFTLPRELIHESPDE